MNRRSFLSLIAAIPGLGWVQKNDHAIVSVTEARSHLSLQPFPTDAPVSHTCGGLLNTNADVVTWTTTSTPAEGDIWIDARTGEQFRVGKTGHQPQTYPD